MKARRQQAAGVKHSAKAAIGNNDRIARQSPATMPAPASNWNAAPRGQLNFGLEDNARFGDASISVVGPAMENKRILNRRIKTVGGVTTTALRRTVIDEMIREEGWVVNDYQKDINGKKVYVVVAQAPGADSRVENRMYYFTESEGKIYKVATRAPKEDAERLAEESEKVVHSIQASKRPVQPQIASNRAVKEEESPE